MGRTALRAVRRAAACDMGVDDLFWHRIQFAFTVGFHYLFPQLTMGLAALIVVFKALHARTGDPAWADASRFWIRVFGLNFVFGVVTGFPLELQFATNWGGFLRQTGGIVGQALFMEGVFAFFLESSLLYVLVKGEAKVSTRTHFLLAVALWLGSWASAYFVICANAFMQRPGTIASRGADGVFKLENGAEFLWNDWTHAAFAHAIAGSVVTAGFVVAATGAWYALRGVHPEHARRFLAAGVLAGFVGAALVAWPTGHHRGRLVARHQPAAFAAMEGRFETGAAADLTVIGQPDVAARTLDNPVRLPGVLSLLAFGTTRAPVLGLEDLPRDAWPDNIELLYYSFHVMVGLGTLLLALGAWGAIQAFRGKLAASRRLHWALLAAFPLPYLANLAGWTTTELGRQPWLVYGRMRTVDGASPTVHAGTTAFSTLGFVGLYFVLGVLFLALMRREIVRGPAARPRPGDAAFRSSP